MACCARPRLIRAGDVISVNTDNCPSGITTQKPELRARLDIEHASQRLGRFFGAAVELMQVLRAGVRIVENDHHAGIALHRAVCTIGGG